MNKKLVSTITLSIVAAAGIIYAAAPTGGYAPNATLDPDCAPGDTDCFVQALVDTNPWYGTDDNALATSNTENIYQLGKIGIGTSTLASTLTPRVTVVNDDSTYGNTTFFVSNGTSNIHLEAKSGGSANSYNPGVETDDARIIFSTDGDHTVSDNNGLVIGPHSNIAGTEGIKIMENGNVGIGTDSPSTRLTVVHNNTDYGNRTLALGNGTSTIHFEPNSGAGTFAAYNPGVVPGDARIIFTTDGDDSVSDNNGLIIAPHASIAGTEGIRIMDNGRVGISMPTTRTPTSSLHVVGSISYVAIAAGTGTTTLDEDDHVALINSTGTVTLPTAGPSTSERVYRIVNFTGSAKTIGSYITLNGTASTTIPAATGITVISSGALWYRIQ